MWPSYWIDVADVTLCTPSWYSDHLSQVIWKSFWVKRHEANTKYCAYNLWPWMDMTLHVVSLWWTSVPSENTFFFFPFGVKRKTDNQYFEYEMKYDLETTWLNIAPAHQKIIILTNWTFQPRYLKVSGGLRDFKWTQNNVYVTSKCDLELMYLKVVLCISSHKLWTHCSICLQDIEQTQLVTDGQTNTSTSQHGEYYIPLLQRLWECKTQNQPIACSNVCEPARRYPNLSVRAASLLYDWFWAAPCTDRLMIWLATSEITCGNKLNICKFTASSNFVATLYFV